jgi:hypothetical protein
MAVLEVSQVAIKKQLDKAGTDKQFQSQGIINWNMPGLL